MNNSIIIDSLKLELSKINSSRKAIHITKISNKYFKMIPSERNQVLQLLEDLIADNKSIELFSIATLWFKRRPDLLDISIFPVVESWLYSYIDSWGKCDQFCYRVLNPFIYEFPNLYENVLKWAKSDKLYIRRAAPVSLLKSSGTFFVNYELEKTLEIVSLLANDSHPHIQKGIGWLLKYAYLTYPEEITAYLKNDISMLSRTTFRYAIEKMPVNLRNEMMNL